MRPLATQKFSKEQIMDMLHAKYKARNVRFRYDLLDKNLWKIRTLPNVESASIEYNSFNDIKRTASFTIKEEYIESHISIEPEDVFYGYGGASERSFGSWTNDDNIYAPIGWDTSSVFLNTPKNLLNNGDFHLWKEEDALPTGWVTTGSILKAERSDSLSLVGSSIKLQKTNTIDSSVGIQTTTTTQVTAAGSEKVYLACYCFLQGNDAAPLPTYTFDLYLYKSGVSYRGTIIEDQRVNNNSNQLRWILAEVTIPAGTASTTYGAHFSVKTNQTNTYAIFSGLYMSKEIARQAATAYSPELTVKYDNPLGVGAPKIDRISAMYTREKDTKNYKLNMFNDPNCVIYMNVNYGGGWLGWQPLNPGGSYQGIPDLANSDNIKVKLKAVMYRYNPNVKTSISNLSVRVTYEIDKWVQKQENINYLEDRIQPFIEYEMLNGEWVSYPLGIFVLDSPTRRDNNNAVYRTISAYDQSVILKEDAFLDTEYINGNVVQEVSRILTEAGVVRMNIPPSDDTAQFTFKIGANKLTSVNEVLQGIGYHSLWVDSNGVFISRPYVKPEKRPVEYSYVDDDLSVMHERMTLEEDFYDTANAWVAVRLSDVDGGIPLTSSYVNDSAASPTSTISIGRRKVDYREVDYVNTQQGLDNYVMMLVDYANQLYGKVEFETALMPMHEHQDNIHIRYEPLGIDDDFQETAWSMNLKAGARMKHKARRLIKI